MKQKGLLLSYIIQNSCLAFLSSQTTQTEIDGASSRITAASLLSAISSDINAVAD